MRRIRTEIPFTVICLFIVLSLLLMINLTQFKIVKSSNQKLFEPDKRRNFFFQGHKYARRNR